MRSFGAAIGLLLLAVSAAHAADAATPPRGANSNRVVRNDYPKESLAAGETGVVIVRTFIREDGTVGEAFVVRSSGFKRLDDAAVALVLSRFRYTPATQGGKPVSTWINQGIKWELSDVVDAAAPRTVMLRIHVSETGAPGEIQIVRSAGTTADDAAIRLAREWRHEPQKDANGKPIAGWITFPVGIQIDSNRNVTARVMPRPAVPFGLQRADYPPESLRLGEQGVAIVNVFVTAEGEVGQVNLAGSSGHARLDEASLKVIRTRFRYTPARDARGRAVGAWIRQAIKWELQDDAGAPAE